MVLGRCANSLSTVSRWSPSGESVVGTFSRQALPMVWDFAETCILANGPGSFDGAVRWVAAVIGTTPISVRGQVQLADAAQHPLPDQSAAVWFTDPPYYDAIGYSDLSDFFFVWAKRALPGNGFMMDPFDPSNPLTPKAREAVVQERGHGRGRPPRDRAFYEHKVARSFQEGRRILQRDAVGSVVFAHKTTEGWEALLTGLVRGGWTVTASWPIATEMGSRLRALDSAALATSIHLVCRPRPEDAPVGDWAEVLRELPRRVGDWMDRLQAQAVRGADLVFACIGPALEVFSRYSKVETAEGREVPFPQFLEKVWEVVGRAALAQVLGGGNGGSAAVEEDARLTALFLWTLQSTNGDGEAPRSEEPQWEEESDEEDVGQEAPKRKPKGLRLMYDVVRRFAQPLGIHLEEWEGRIIETEKGVVRLLPVGERAEQLFGKEGAQAVADQIETTGIGPLQLALFPSSGEAAPPQIRDRPKRGSSDGAVESLRARREATTLDRVHAAMLLQKSGRTSALRALLGEEVQHGSEFLRLANALSALYPRSSEEKRLLDAMLLAAPR